MPAVIYQNLNNRAGEKGNCGFDRRLNFVTSIVATSPSIGNGFEKQLTGGWQFSPIFTAYTGQPFTVTDNGKDISLTGQNQDRPNVILPNQVIPATRTQKEWFNQAAFALQPAGTYGNSGRFSLYNPGYWNLDVALTRPSRSANVSPRNPWRSLQYLQSRQLERTQRRFGQRSLRPDHSLQLAAHPSGRVEAFVLTATQLGKPLYSPWAACP